MRDLYTFKFIEQVSNCKTLYLNEMMLDLDQLKTTLKTQELHFDYDKLGGDSIELNKYVPLSSKNTVKNIYVEIKGELETLLYYHTVDWISHFPNFKHLNLIVEKFTWDDFFDVMECQIETRLSYYTWHESIDHDDKVDITKVKHFCYRNKEQEIKYIRTTEWQILHYEDPIEEYNLVKWNKPFSIKMLNKYDVINPKIESYEMNQFSQFVEMLLSSNYNKGSGPWVIFPYDDSV